MKNDEWYLKEGCEACKHNKKVIKIFEKREQKNLKQKDKRIKELEDWIIKIVGGKK